MIWILGYFLLINLIAFVVCFVDKRKSIKDKWRIQEKTLLILSLLGGGIGMFVGMRVFKHKTKKLKFTVGVPVITVLVYGLVIFCLIKFF